MANKRLDVIVSKQVGDKKYWTKIGAAFETDKGGFSVYLDALPIDGKLLLTYPREDRGNFPSAGGGGGYRGGQRSGGSQRRGGPPQRVAQQEMGYPKEFDEADEPPAPHDPGQDDFG